MSEIFSKYFKKTLNEDALQPAGTEGLPPEATDQQAFDNSFSDQDQLSQVNDEVSATAIDPNEQAKIIKLADSYAEKVTESILPVLRKLHQDLISGVFKTVAPDIKSISGITEDLASLAEALRGRTRDAIIKSNEKDSK